MDGSGLAPSRSGATHARGVWRRYADYLRRPPLLSIEWADRETNARGWLVINSLRGGAAGGGTRMRAGLARREVVYLAKTMELKFLFSGPPIGGAKSGIDFDPSDRRRGEVLKRWFRAVAPQLRAWYGTGGDLNVDEVIDVIPCCSALGLRHPQEGVVRGHFDPDARSVPAILDALDQGVKAPVEGTYGVPGLDATVADLITGYGLARAILALLERRAEPVAGLRIALEGFGAVGGPCALYLARAGARIVAIADREKALLSPSGVDAAGVEDLLRRRVDKCLPSDAPGAEYAADPRAIDTAGAEVFVSAAASEMLDPARLDRLGGAGVRVIACGANQTFREAKLGATAVQRSADARFTIIPDVVANCGMARAFSHFMEASAGTAPGAVFAAVDRTISGAVAEICARNHDRTRGMLAATLEYALDRIGEDPTNEGPGRTRK